MPWAEHVFSPTQVTHFGQCAYRWYVQHSLRLKQPELAQFDLEPQVRGRLYHRVLEAVGLALQNAPEVDRAEVVEQALTTAEAEEGLGTRLYWLLQRSQHLVHLQALVCDPEFLPLGHQILAVEAQVEWTWQGLNLQGTLDRLDRTPQGWRVIDYKTSASKPLGTQDADGVCRIDVQLPLYLEAVRNEMPDDLETLEGQYFSLTRAQGRVLAQAQPNQKGLIDLVDRLKRSADAGRMSIAPDRTRQVCRYCSLGGLCRDSHRLPVGGAS